MQPDEVVLGIGMSVTAAFNVETDLDIANGASGEVMRAALGSNESNYSPMQPTIRLKYPPAYVHVRIVSASARALKGLEVNATPLVLVEHAAITRHFKRPRWMLQRQCNVTFMLGQTRVVYSTM